MTEEDPDRELVVRWKRASAEQQEVSQEIFDRYSQRVAGLFQRKGHPTDRVQELTQETFLRVFKKLGSYRGGAQLRLWILLIAKRVHFSEVRRLRSYKREHQEVPLEDSADEPRQFPADVMSPEEEFLEKERKAALLEAIAELPLQRRRCIELYQRGYTLQQIAEMLHIKQDTVKAHRHQARQQLRKTLGQHFADAAL